MLSAERLLHRVISNQIEPNDKIDKYKVIRQKRESQNSVSRKQSTPNFPKNELFLPPRTHTYVRNGGKKCSFFGKFGVLCFCETPILRFALLPYYRGIGVLYQSYHSSHFYFKIEKECLLPHLLHK